MKHALAIFRFLVDATARGERTVLVTLTDVVGSSSRAPGTHMAVSETGEWVGSLSGGCVEAAVVTEARAVLARGRAELVRFGVGSRFIDIRLPCGGGMDLLFTPDPPLAVVQDVVARLASRRTVDLLFDLRGALTIDARPAPGWLDGRFGVRHQPDLSILVIGHGAEAIALARVAVASGFDVDVLTPDRRVFAQARGNGASATLLQTPSSTSEVWADAHTAIVFLFHDHDWEPALMAASLATPTFFIGAMGSRATHARRQALLVARGVAPEDAHRIIGPVGLVPAVRDPDTLALSILAQIALVARENGEGRIDAATVRVAASESVCAEAAPDRRSAIA